MNKRSALPLMLSLIVCLLLSTFTTATAAPLHDDPVVKIISGGAALETKIIPLEQLPGVTVSDAGLSQPEFSSSDMSQFGGDGVRVKGLLGSVASVCFTAKPPSAGWTNTVHRWTGFTWEEIPTVVSTTEGGINPKACATVYYDGKYALLVGYKEPVSEKVTNSLPECTGVEVHPGIGGHIPNQIVIYNAAVYATPAYEDGTVVGLEILNVQPSDMFSGNLVGSGVVTSRFDSMSGQWDYLVQYPETITFPSTGDWWSFSSFTMRYTFPNCYVDVGFPDFLN